METCDSRFRQNPETFEVERTVRKINQNVWISN